jgi:FKBP-type peptidyl-prolyl cis-trans isomerase 2
MEKGDIVYIEYELWLKDSNKLVDTTHEELAKKENIYEEKKKYGAIPLVIGSGVVVKGLENSLLNAEIGKDYELELLPSEAYGERDPNLVEIFSIHEFRRRKLEPKLGMEVNLRNKIGVITAVTAGRVRVDFNHRLAGKTLKYKYKLVKKLEEDKEKVQALLESYYGNSESFELAVQEKEAIIKLPDVCKYDPRWLAVKYKIVSSLREYVGLKKIQFIEEYIKKESKDQQEGETEKALD